MGNLRASRTVVLNDKNDKPAYTLLLELGDDGGSTVSIQAKQFKLSPAKVPESEFIEGVKQLLGSLTPADFT